MPLPTTSVPELFLMSPSQRFVAFNSSLAVSSVVDRITNKPVQPLTSAAAPTWSNTAMGGAYFSANFPGSQDRSGLAFAGSQNLEFDYLATSFDGYANLTITTVCQCTTPSGGMAQTVWALGASGSATPTLALQYKSGNLQLVEINSNGTYTASATTDSNVHVVTCSRVNGVLTLRVDGTQVATATAVLSGDAFNTFCMGQLNSNGATSLGFTGSMGHCMAWLGSADVERTEAFLVLEYGIVRNTTAL